MTSARFFKNLIHFSEKDTKRPENWSLLVYGGAGY